VPDYKRQHYLPAAYLKYFSVDQTQCNRDALVWRFDGEGQRLVPVKSQCHDDYFYSKEKAEEIEQTFGILESEYCECVDKIRAGEQLSEKQCGRLMLFMIDLFLRNDIHETRPQDTAYPRL
jgi:hypothetical protein